VDVRPQHVRWRFSSASPVIAALALFALLFVATTWRLLQVTQGQLTYALDDAYIHMAIAKNLALHGTWGVQADAFAAASSSPLWTILLAASFKLVGVRDAVPLALNMASAVLCVIVLDAMLKRDGLSGIARFTVLAGVVFFVPLVPMVWIGMEHTLHVVLTLVTAWAARRLAAHYSARRLVELCALIAMMVGARYEGLFVLAGCVITLAMARRQRAAGAAIVAGFIPVVAVGFWNLSHGWFFLPASVMMKQTVLPHADGGTLLKSLAVNIVRPEAPAPYFVLVGIATALIASQAISSRRLNRTEPLLAIFLTAALLHLLLARFGWLFRYESYLMALGVYAVGVSVFATTGGWRPGAETDRVSRRGSRPDAVTILVVLCLGIGAFGQRTIISHGVVATTAGHIFRQHRQMAEFVGRFYDRDAVATNDIGAVSYFTDARVHDLEGLGSLEAARMRREGRFDSARINSWLALDGVDIAVIYDARFRGAAAFQRDWIRLGSWTTDVPANTETTVTFYARSTRSAHVLRANLREFSRRLPSGVIQTLEPSHVQQ